MKRDAEVLALLKTKGADFKTYKDYVILVPREVLKDDGRPYTVFAPFSKKWKRVLQQLDTGSYPSHENLGSQVKLNHHVPELRKFGFQTSLIDHRN